MSVTTAQPSMSLTFQKSQKFHFKIYHNSKKKVSKGKTKQDFDVITNIA